MIINTTTLDTLCDMATTFLKNVTTEDGEFIVSDLFSPLEWRRLPLETRMTLGAKLLTHIEGSNEFEVVKKDDLGRQVYRKVR